MKALVYHGPGQLRVEDQPRPQVHAPTDAIVSITKTTICGTDLHILKGDVPEVAAGRILGHEGVGVVEEVGAGVSSFAVGDLVLISCITSCGKCANCKKGHVFALRKRGGWILGHHRRHAGRICAHSLCRRQFARGPAGADEEALVMLSDILPTGYECGVLNGHVKPGDTVAIMGAGPVGLAALLTAQFYSPSRIILVDVDENRLKVARNWAPPISSTAADGDAIAQMMELTQRSWRGRGDGSGRNSGDLRYLPAIVTAGGVIANIGVHGKPVQLNLDKLWSRNITLTTRLVDTATTPLLLKTVMAGKVAPKQLVTHRFALNDIMAAYDTFGRAMQERALKVIVSND